MSAKTDLWDYLHIGNAYDVAERAQKAGLPDVYISYTPGASASWQVVRPGFLTDPESAWYNHGQKTFNVFRREKKNEQLAAAWAWAEKRYGISTWQTIPGIGVNAWYPAEVAQWIKDQLKSAKKAAKQ